MAKRKSTTYTARRTWYVVCEKCDLITLPGLRYCFLHRGRIGDRCDLFKCPRPRWGNSCYCERHDKAMWALRDRNKWLAWLILDDEGKV
jgi:hypothetical protein